MRKWANLTDKKICNTHGRIKIQEYQKTHWDSQAGLNSCWVFCIFNCKPQSVKHSSRGFLAITPCIPHFTGLQSRRNVRAAPPKSRALCLAGAARVRRTQPYLSGEAAPQVHGSRASFVGLQPQHHRGGQLVMGSAATGLLLQGTEGTELKPWSWTGLAHPKATGQESVTPLLQHRLSQTALGVLIPLIFQI